MVKIQDHLIIKQKIIKKKTKIKLKTFSIKKRRVTTSQIIIAIKLYKPKLKIFKKNSSKNIQNIINNLMR